MYRFNGVESFASAVGQELGVSGWLTVDQERIDRFAEATEDRQWIHIDPERAKHGPFGTTVAHGFLTLSLVVPLMNETYIVENCLMSVNYGLNRVRFPAPTPAGTALRARTALTAYTPLASGVQAEFGVSVEAKGGGKPVCVAEVLGRFLFDDMEVVVA